MASETFSDTGACVFDAYYQAGLDYSLAAVGIDDPDLREDLMALYRDIAPYPEVTAVLETLKAAGIRCDRLDLAPERICFQSANAWDIAGAATFGFRTVWINRGGQPRERLPGGPAAELDTLSGLPALLGL